MMTNDTKNKDVVPVEDNITLIEHQTDILIICDVNMTNTLPTTSIYLIDHDGEKHNITDTFDIQPIMSLTLHDGGLVETNQTLRFRSTKQTNLATFENHGKVIQCEAALMYYAPNVASAQLNIVCEYFTKLYYYGINI